MSRDEPLRKRIAIISGAPLSWNPRTYKEACLLASVGYDVVVYGVSLNSEGCRRDQKLATENSFSFRSVAPKFGHLFGGPLRAWCRLRYRFAKELFQLVGYNSRYIEGVYAPELESAARKESSSYLILHNEASILLGRRLLRDGYHLGADLEDWHSEDLPLYARVGRPVEQLRKAEEYLLRFAGHVTCPSRAMSDALQAEFSVKTPPAVIYNSFSIKEADETDRKVLDRRNPNSRTILWFSQTIGPYRGLEDLFAALPHIEKPVEIHLRGTCVPNFESWLRTQLSTAYVNKVFIHAPVPFEELPSRIAEHDIGFAGEIPHCRSRDLTVTNKILQYLLGGLAVVASDTKGQSEIAKKADGAVILFPSGNPRALADRINFLLDNPDRLEKMRKVAKSIATSNYCWELDRIRLLKIIDGAVQGKARS